MIIQVIFFFYSDAFDDDFIVQTLNNLKNGKKATLRLYDAKDHAKTDKFVIDGSKTRLILLEGLLALYFANVRSLLQLQIFMDVDSDNRMMSRSIFIKLNSN
ncbi:hypothetical protein HZS_6814 [Henneguya salminicola]|nr:hypothetical protein HZS_6814 [Henneguya salminicola]